MTPILVRPVREQLEHDRVIRLLQQRWRRKYLVGINQGNETGASVSQGESTLYPDVVLAPLSRPNKPAIVVEVETGESVNNLEARAEWARLAQVKAAFHLYVPAGSVEPAKRLCAVLGIPVAEIWTYHPVGDQMRFTQIYKAPEPSRPVRRSSERASPARKGARPSGAKKKPQAASKGSAAKRTAAKRAAKPAAARRPARAASARRAQPKKAAARPAAKTKKRR